MKEIEFQCAGHTLRGVLHMPDMENPPLVIGSHGLEGTMESAKQLLLAGLLPPNGVAFFRFDHRGCGKSEGDFLTETSLGKRVQDMVHAALHVLSLDLTSKKIMVFGSSLGGATCISAWQRLVEKNIPPCGAVICAAPVNSITIDNIPTEANDKRPELPLTFFEDNLLFDLSDKLGALKHVLIFHGDEDVVVPVENAYNLHSNVREPKKLIIFKNGDHQMSNKDDQDRFIVETLRWIKGAFSSII